MTTAKTTAHSNETMAPPTNTTTVQHPTQQEDSQSKNSDLKNNTGPTNQLNQITARLPRAKKTNPIFTLEEVKVPDTSAQKKRWKQWRTSKEYLGLASEVNAYKMIFGEKGSLHDDAKLWKKHITIERHAVPSVEQCLTLFNNSFSSPSFSITDDAKKLREIATRCALTDPFDFKDDMTYQDKFSKTDLIHLWIAAFVLFGTPWKTGSSHFSIQDVKMVDASAPKPTEEGRKSALKSSKKESRTNLAVSSKVSYLSRPLRKKLGPSISLRDSTKKFRTLIKLRLPTLESDSFNGRNMEAVSHFKNIMLFIWEVDPTVQLDPWKGEHFIKSITSPSRIPKTRQALLDFVDSIWTSKGISPYVRVFVSHDNPIDQFFTREVQFRLRQQDFGIYSERIQHQEVTKIGWLLGYHILTHHTNNLCSAIEACPEMAGIKISTRVEYVKITPYDRKDDTFKAVVISVASHQAIRCRNALRKIYSSARQDYPNGVIARFIQSTVNRQFAVGDQVLQQAKLARSKQRAFLTNCSTLRSFCILGLDFVIPEYKMSLRQAIMSIFSRDDPSRSLFVSVEEQTETNQVIFAFKSTHDAEAGLVIPGLPLYLEKKLGPRIWTWFDTPAAEALLVGYKWVEGKGLEEIVDSIDDFSDFSDDDTMDSSHSPKKRKHHQVIDLQPQSFLPEASRKNAYGDDGTIATGLFESTSQDSGGRTTTVQTEPMSMTSPSSSLTTDSVMRRRFMAEIAGNPEMLKEFQSLQNTTTDDGATQEEDCAMVT